MEAFSASARPLDQRAQLPPERRVDHLTVGVPLVGAVEDLAEDVVLALLAGRVDLALVPRVELLEAPALITGAGGYVPQYRRASFGISFSRRSRAEELDDQLNAYCDDGDEDQGSRRDLVAGVEVTPQGEQPAA